MEVDGLGEPSWGVVLVMFQIGASVVVVLKLSLLKSS